MVIVLILIISQVESEKPWPLYAPAVEGDSLSLDCVFDAPVNCRWTRGRIFIDPAHGYLYRGHPRLGNRTTTTDCSLTIAAVKQEDFALWHCTPSSSRNIPPHSIYVTPPAEIEELSSDHKKSQGNLTTAVVGDGVTLACRLRGTKRQTICFWLRYTKGPTQHAVIFSNGYYISDQFNTPIKYCLLRIAAVKQEDFARWTCVATTKIDTHEPVSAGITRITKRVTPSPPVILFNERRVSVMEVPSADPPSRMVCQCDNGNPPPQMHWEVNGVKYLGRVHETVDAYHRTHQLHWDTAGGWHTLHNASHVVCIAQHPGFTSSNSRITLELNHTGGSSSDDEHSHGYLVIIARVLGALLVITLLILIVVVIRSRWLLMNRKLKCVTPLPSLAELNRVCSNVNILTNTSHIHHHTNFGCSYPSTSSFSNSISDDDDYADDNDAVKYVNVEQTNAQPAIYDVPM